MNLMPSGIFRVLAQDRIFHGLVNSFLTTQESYNSCETTLSFVTCTFLMFLCTTSNKFCLQHSEAQKSFICVIGSRDAMLLCLYELFCNVSPPTFVYDGNPPHDS